MKKLLYLYALLVIVSINISAQTTAPKQISGGVLNGKAASLAKPKYPAAAKSVGASGSVSVQVLIDEEGNVATANAVSGHPLLRAASEQAARESKFAPTTLSGQPVKVSGIIVYNFVGNMSFSQIGFDLAVIEKSKIISEQTSISNISANIPADWEKEQADLKLLSSSSQNLVKVTKNVPDPMPNDNTEAKKRDNVFTIIGTNSGNVSKTIDNEKVVSDLMISIENRLSSQQTQQWKFNVGKTLGRIAAQNDQNEIKAEASKLNSLILNAPSDISAATLESLRKLVESIETNDSTTEGNTEFNSMAAKLRNL